MEKNNLFDVLRSLEALTGAFDEVIAGDMGGENFIEYAEDFMEKINSHQIENVYEDDFSVLKNAVQIFKNDPGNFDAINEIEQPLRDDLEGLYSVVNDALEKSGVYDK